MVRGEQFPSLVLLQRLLALGTSALFFGSCVDELELLRSPVSLPLGRQLYPAWWSRCHGCPAQIPFTTVGTSPAREP